ncbi:MAG: hypothetical protein AMXMBFR47_45350 [Planctomycetota bacterium]
MWKPLTLLICAIPALADGPRWSSSRDVVLSCEAVGRVTKTSLWVSGDDGRRWTQSPHRFDGGRIHATLPADGRWSFYIVLENDAGASAGAPGDGSLPHATIVVDTAAPTFQILSARADRSTGVEGRPQVLLRTALVEENLGQRGIRAFYRTAGAETWRDGGAIEPARVGDQRELCWLAPLDAGDRLQLMIVVTDLAGNRASDVSDVIRLEPAEAVPASQCASQPTAASGPASQPARDPDPAISDLAGPPDIAALRRAEALRRRAQQNLLTGETGLALARFEEAIEADPSDAATYTQLGAALLRANRLDDARARFDAALKLSDGSVEAIEGLAQVAVGQQRFADARDLLRRIVEQSPDSAHTWLRLGDVEFKLGRRAEAIAAWRRAAATGGTTDIGEKAAARLKTFAEKPAN